MLFRWPRPRERRAELRTQAFVPIVSTPVRSNPTAARRFFSANFLPATGSFPNTRDFPFSPAKATRRRTQAASRSSRVAAALRVPRSRLCLSVRELALQLCGLQLQILHLRVRCGNPNRTLVDRGFGWRRDRLSAAPPKSSWLKRVSAEHAGSVETRKEKQGVSTTPCQPNKKVEDFPASARLAHCGCCG